MQHVKGVEKFFLCTFFSYNKLNIVDHQDIYSPVFFAQLCHGGCVTASDGFDYFVGKGFRSDIKNLHIRILLQDEVTDGMHQMRLSQTGTAVDKQRIVGISGRFRNCETGGMSEFVVIADNEGVELVLGV